MYNKSYIKTYFVKKKKEIDEVLDRFLPSGPDTISQAMRYSVFPGGKRLRPVLALAAVEIFRDIDERDLIVSSAIELIHSFTLVHDDLPGMDNDDYRRGKPATHKVFGQGVSITIGDILLNQAFELIVKDYIVKKGDPSECIRILREICEAIGIRGVFGGQVKDIQSENKKLQLSTLEKIYNDKTGSLISSSVRIGGILGGANRRELGLLTAYGRDIGLSFQIMDDVLEYEDDKGGIHTLKKPNYVSLAGVKSARKKALEKIIEAKKNLSIFGKRGDILKRIADYIIYR